MRKMEQQLDEMSEAMQSALKLIIIAIASLGGIFTSVGAILFIIKFIVKLT